MKLCVFIIVSGVLCLGACKVADFFSGYDDSSCVIILAFTFSILTAIGFGICCLGLSFYGLYLLAVAFMGV